MENYFLIFFQKNNPLQRFFIYNNCAGILQYVKNLKYFLKMLKTPLSVDVFTFCFLDEPALILQ